MAGVELGSRHGDICVIASVSSQLTSEVKPTSKDIHCSRSFDVAKIPFHIFGEQQLKEH